MNIIEKYKRYKKGEFIEIKNKYEKDFLDHEFTDDQLFILSALGRYQDKITSFLITMFFIIGLVLGGMVTSQILMFLYELKNILAGL